MGSRYVRPAFLLGSYWYQLGERNLCLTSSYMLHARWLQTHFYWSHGEYIPIWGCQAVVSVSPTLSSMSVKSPGCWFIEWLTNQQMCVRLLTCRMFVTDSVLIRTRPSRRCQPFLLDCGRCDSCPRHMVYYLQHSSSVSVLEYKCAILSTVDFSEWYVSDTFALHRLLIHKTNRINLLRVSD